MDETGKKIPIGQWHISPFRGVGTVTFGLTRDQVRSLLGKPAFSFQKGSEAPVETDAYPDMGIHLYFDTDEHLECIEFSAPARVFYRGVQLNGVSIQQLLEDLLVVGASHRYDDGYFFDTCGFVLDAPVGIVQAVTVYRRGYYEDSL